jgi:hypothetical protein
MYRERLNIFNLNLYKPITARFLPCGTCFWLHFIDIDLDFVSKMLMPIFLQMVK